MSEKKNGGGAKSSDGGPLLTQGSFGDAKKDEQYDNSGSGDGRGTADAGIGQRHWGPGEFTGEEDGTNTKSTDIPPSAPKKG